MAKLRGKNPLFYRTARWLALSKLIRAKHPYCLTCAKPSECVDHLDGDTGNNKEENLIALCSSCHAIKTCYCERAGRSIAQVNDFASFVEYCKDFPYRIPAKNEDEIDYIMHGRYSTSYDKTFVFVGMYIPYVYRLAALKLIVEES